jgi:hypothetical protein
LSGTHFFPSNYHYHNAAHHVIHFHFCPYVPISSWFLSLPPLIYIKQPVGHKD